MKTIEERAKELASKSEDLFQNTAYAYYICGATKQREIDIQSACDWLDEHLYDYLTSDGPMEQYYIKCGDLIEDLKQAMKGE